jgi:hypothetical protein
LGLVFYEIVHFVVVFTAKPQGRKVYGVLFVDLETFILAICHAGSVPIMLLSFVGILPSSE